MLTWRELWNGHTPISLKTTEAYATGAAWFLAAAHNTLQSQYDDDNHPALRQIKREQRVANELREHATQKIADKQAGRDKTMGGHVSSLPDAWLDRLTNDVAIMRNIYIHMFCAPWRRQNHDVIIHAKDLYMGLCLLAISFILSPKFKFRYNKLDNIAHLLLNDVLLTNLSLNLKIFQPHLVIMIQFLHASRLS